LIILEKNIKLIDNEHITKYGNVREYYTPVVNKAEPGIEIASLTTDDVGFSNTKKFVRSIISKEFQR
jgi:hypothetical protein